MKITVKIRVDKFAYMSVEEITYTNTYIVFRRFCPRIQIRTFSYRTFHYVYFLLLL